MGSERTRGHPLKPKSKGTFDHTRFNCIVGLVKSSATCRAVVIDIRDWYTSQAQVVERALQLDEYGIYFHI